VYGLFVGTTLLSLKSGAVEGWHMLCVDKRALVYQYKGTTVVLVYLIGVRSIDDPYRVRGVVMKLIQGNETAPIVESLAAFEVAKAYPRHSLVLRAC